LIAEVVADLFERRPRTELELRARLAPVDPDAGRGLLIERLRTIGAPPRDSATLVGALQVLGLGAGDLPPLEALLVDPEAKVSGRAVALALVSALDPGRAQSIARALPADHLMAMNDAQLTSVIATMPAAPARTAEITHKLQSQPVGSRLLRFAQIERIRRRLGIPAALLYRDALAHDDPALGDSLADRIAEEGGEGAMILLEQTWRAASEPEVQARCMRALTRLHRAPIAAAAAAREGLEGWILDGEPSAEGSSAAVCFESAVDGSFTIATARLSPAGAIDAAAVVILASRPEVVALVSGEHGRALVSAPASAAGDRVEEAARRMRAAEAPVSLEIHAAICFFGLASRPAAP
jgi:hypothetical protein